MDITLTSKFKLGDTALRFNPGTKKLEKYLVRSIHFQVYEDRISVGYHSSGDFSYAPEEDLFASKEEFINQL